MSSQHVVTLTCDVCGAEDTSTTGSYCRPGWTKINIEVWAYDNAYDKHGSTIINSRTEDRMDFCDRCLKKHGLSGLRTITANKPIK